MSGSIILLICDVNECDMVWLMPLLLGLCKNIFDYIVSLCNYDNSICLHSNYPFRFVGVVKMSFF